MQQELWAVSPFLYTHPAVTATRPRFCTSLSARQPTCQVPFFRPPEGQVFLRGGGRGEGGGGEGEKGGPHFLPSDTQVSQIRTNTHVRAAFAKLCLYELHIIDICRCTSICLTKKYQFPLLKKRDDVVVIRGWKAYREKIGLFKI